MLAPKAAGLRTSVWWLCAHQSRGGEELQNAGTIMSEQYGVLAVRGYQSRSIAKGCEPCTKVHKAKRTAVSALRLRSRNGGCDPTADTSNSQAWLMAQDDDDFT